MHKKKGDLIRFEVEGREVEGDAIRLELEDVLVLLEEINGYVERFQE